MTDTGRLHKNVLSKQRSGVQTTHSGMKRTAHQMREAISIKVNRGGNDTRGAEAERPAKSGDHQGSTCGDHQSCRGSCHNGVNKDRFTQTKLPVLLRTTKCSQSEKFLEMLMCFIN